MKKAGYVRHSAFTASQPGIQAFKLLLLNGLNRCHRLTEGNVTSAGRGVDTEDYNQQASYHVREENS